MRICQFKLGVIMEGGGERVMRAIARVLNAKIYTMINRTNSEDIQEISTEAERRLLIMEVK